MLNISQTATDTAIVTTEAELTVPKLLNATFYWSAIVNIALSCIIFELFVGYKFAPKGYINLRDFYNILHGGGRPETALSCEISTL